MYLTVTVIASFAVAALLLAWYFLFDSSHVARRDILLGGKIDTLIIEEAKNGRQAVRGGDGIAVRRVIKDIQRAQKVIVRRNSSSETMNAAEMAFCDGYRHFVTMGAALARRSEGFRTLFHVDGEARVVRLCRLIISSTGGYASSEELLSLIKLYNEETPLCYDEIISLRDAFVFSALQLAAEMGRRLRQISEREDAGKADAENDRINVSLLKSSAYLSALRRNASDKLRREIDSVCADNGYDYRRMQDGLISALSSYGVVLSSVSKLVSEIDQTFSLEYILKLSPIHECLTVRAGKAYECCTTETKHAYLSEIAFTAKRKRLSELSVALAAIARAEADGNDIADEILPKKKGVLTAVIYVMLPVTLSALLCVLIRLIYGIPLFVELISYLPLFFGVLKITERLFSFSRRRVLPKIKIDEKSDNLINVTCVRLVADVEEISDAFLKIKTMEKANPEPYTSFTLLFDFPAARTETVDDDKALLDAIYREFAKLDEEKFNVLVRNRTFLKEKNLFQGWEKKRGALLTLNSLILRNERSAFRLILGKSYKARYVATIDADTLSYSVKQLAEILEHPYNAESAVVSFSLRSFPSGRKASVFSSCFSGESGVDGYCSCGNGCAFDLFGRGNFTGKGAYRVKDFDERVSKAFPDNRVLSHDFLEGAYAGCLQSGEIAFEEFPSTFTSYLKRSQRWLRGDFQLIPWLFHTVRNRDNKRAKNRLCLIDRWHILLNLLCGLLPILQLALITVSAFVVPSWALILAIAPAIASIATSLPQLFNSPKDFFKLCLMEVFWFAVLPVIAICNLCSVAVTAFRLCAGKNLLEWKVFAQTKGKDTVMLINAAYATVLLVLNLFFASAIAAYVCVSIFVLALPIESLLSDGKKPRALPSSQRNSLYFVASRTWRYFSELCSKSKSFLPPDNYNEDGGRVALRTSPTNIGMALTAACSAYEIGIIGRAESEEFILKILLSIRRLRKWNGIPYNWYDTETLSVLPPYYVSSVDAGNLICGLMLAAQYLSSDDDKALAEKLINECCLKPLFDEKRGLLRIGYNESEASYDGYYDLAGSEALATYLVAIGKGDIPKSAFSSLSFSSLKAKGKALASWSGGAFEYLMPTLYFEYPKGTVFYTSAKSVVRTQRLYAKRNNFKYFGVSESQYFATEDNGDYKYKAFGVPSLALSNETEGMVFAPYAGFLCAEYASYSVIVQSEQLATDGMIGKYGAYEAIDAENVIRSFMAHHQGMTLAALCNCMTDFVLQKRMSERADVCAAQLLLLKKESSSPVVKKVKSNEHYVNPSVRTVNAMRSRRALSLLSSNGYNLVLDENGFGYAMMDKYLLTRKNAAFLTAMERNGVRTSLTSTTNAVMSRNATEYTYRDDEVAVKTYATVLRCMAGEVRRVTVKNRTDKRVELSLVAAVEPVLDCWENDVAHREYDNMFLSVKRIQDGGVSAKRKGCPYVIGFACDGDAEYSGSRARLYGRRSSPDFDGVLDCAMWGRIQLVLREYEERSVCFFVVAAKSEEELYAKLHLVKSKGFFFRDTDTALPTSIDYERTCEMASVITSAFGMYMDNSLCGAVNTEYPTVTVEVDRHSLERCKRDIRILSGLFKFGFTFNLAIVYKERHGYLTTVASECEYELRSSGAYERKPNCVQILLVNGIESPKLYDSLLSQSVKLDKDNYALIRDFSILGRLLPCVKLQKITYDLELGRGGFLANGAFACDVSVAPPKPWSNVIAREGFGTVITDGGGGFTFLNNSGERKLTRWNNDAVVDYPSEFIVLSERGNVWSPTRMPIKRDCEYRVEHGFGYTRFTCNYNGFVCELTEFVGRTPVKYYALRLSSLADFSRTVEVSLCLDLVLGNFKERTISAVNVLADGNRIRAYNAVNGIELFVDSTEKLCSYSFDIRALQGLDGSICRALPIEELRGSQIVYGVRTTVPAKGDREMYFCLSGGAEVDFSIAQEILCEAKRYYSNLSPVRIECEDKHLSYLYRWLPYQVLCSRFFGRTGFYQTSGAYGFRDQLQDLCTVNYVDSDLSRRHILRAASKQFVKGDVMHWFHEGIGGVRTHFSDDRLFLPLAVAEYISVTGDRSILLERVPYLNEVSLKNEDKAAYANPGPSQRTDTILEHCRKAIFSVELADSGLALMKGGDWNDGMDEAGANGKGVSVFTTMLLYMTLKRMLPYFVTDEDKNKILALMVRLKEGLDKAWTGDRFIRLITDDGRVLGSERSGECKIDLLVQAFSVLSGAVDDERARLAVATACAKLVDRENGIVKLLHPPIKADGIGYISKYPRGIRENGGQYTHAAIWFVMALYELGECEKAYSLLQLLNPVLHCLTAEGVEKYKNEPYVLSGDVYAYENAGEGGWSWYTGAASWAYKCITEKLLGVTFRGEYVYFSPSLPKHLKGVRLSIKRKNCELKVAVDNTNTSGEWHIVLDGVGYNNNRIRLGPRLNGKEITLTRG